MVEAGQGLRDEEDAHARRHQLDRVRRGRRALDGGTAGQGLPVEEVVQRVQHDLVGQLGERHLLRGGRDVVLGDHDDGRLGVERDRAQDVPVDREPYETGVGAAARQQARRLGGGGLDEFQRGVGQPLVPDPHPLGGRHSGNVREPEG